ncbi:hypothetical protein Arth_1017 [Arthrobacter sp. FB24]|nr:hypothetical protein Arth_1017 [Arthrobacter sp. FB24]
MGFITRRIVPRKVRRLAHPVRAAKRAVVPKPVRRALGTTRNVTHPVSALGYSAERAVFGPHSKSQRARTPASSYGICGVRHRSMATAAKCRKCRRVGYSPAGGTSPGKGILWLVVLIVLGAIFASGPVGVTFGAMIIASGLLWLVLPRRKGPPHSG